MTTTLMMSFDNSVQKNISGIPEREPGIFSLQTCLNYLAFKII